MEREFEMVTNDGRIRAIAETGFVTPKFNIMNNMDVFYVFDYDRANFQDDGKTEVVLLQTISGDLACGAGIARKINRRFNFKQRVYEAIDDYSRFSRIPNRDIWILKEPEPIGTIVPTLADGASINRSEFVGDIWGLVTKTHYWEKPTYETMRTALLYLRDAITRFHAVDGRNYIFVMPAIGCGLDGLNWEKVFEILSSIFDQCPFVRFDICLNWR